MVSAHSQPMQTWFKKRSDDMMLLPQALTLRPWCYQLRSSACVQILLHENQKSRSSGLRAECMRAYCRATLGWAWVACCRRHVLVILPHNPCHTWGFLCKKSWCIYSQRSPRQILGMSPVCASNPCNGMLSIYASNLCNGMLWIYA
jgi:hypothetical protein